MYYCVKVDAIDSVCNAAVGRNTMVAILDDSDWVCEWVCLDDIMSLVRLGKISGLVESFGECIFNYNHKDFFCKRINLDIGFGLRRSKIKGSAMILKIGDISLMLHRGKIMLGKQVLHQGLPSLSATACYVSRSLGGIYKCTISVNVHGQKRSFVSIWFSMKPCMVLGIMYRDTLKWQVDDIPSSLSDSWSRIKTWNTRAGLLGCYGLDI